MLTWPSDLPQHVRQSGFSDTLPDGVLRTKMEAGPGKARRRFSAAARPLACSLLLDRQQLARFDRFVQEETKNGSLPFLMFDPVYDGAELDGLATEGGLQVLVERKNLVMFAEPPVKTPFGPVFQVAFNLSVLP